MRNWSIGHLAIWSIAALLASAQGYAAPAPPPDVQVRTSIDRTAVWIADRIVYTIELRCRPGVDVLDDDLSRDKLKFEGLQTLSGDAAQQAGADGTTTHRYVYTLTTYGFDVAELRIAPLSVRYYVKKPGVRLEDAAPAGETEVPGAVIAFRSTLPDQQETASLRDGRTAAPRPRRFALAQPVGLGLVIASFAPALLWAAAFVRRRRDRVVHRSVRQARSEERASLESARTLDLETVDGRREAYTRINTVLRDHLQDVCGVAGPSLTPAEVGPALSRRDGRVPAAEIAALLGECQRARYAPPDALPSADRCRDALAEAEQVLAIR